MHAPRHKPVAALAAALLLTIPAVAEAGTIKHRGTIAGVSDAKVRFAVEKERGELLRIRNMDFVNVPFTCGDGAAGTVNGYLPTFPVHGDEFRRRGKIEGAGIEDGALRVTGSFSAGGRRASGKVRISFKSTEADAGCGTANVDWTTQRTQPAGGGYEPRR